MADIQKRASAGGVRWDVRYRDESRRQRKKSFDRKVDAQRFAASVETDLNRGDWIDPDRGRELFGDWADKWLATTADRKPKTRETYESIVRKHLMPRFGRAPIGSIDYPTVSRSSLNCDRPESRPRQCATSATCCARSSSSRSGPAH